MNKPAPILLLSFLAAVPLAGQLNFARAHLEEKTCQKTPDQAESALVIPAEEKEQKNPMPPTKESREAGQKIFSSQCVMCHGEKGDGKGDLAVEDNLPVPDFTRPETQKGRTDGELFFILKTGHGHMPAQGKRLREDQRWNLINYIRTLLPREEVSTEKNP